MLNPGKIVDAPSMTEHLRDADPPAPGPLRTRLHFDVVGGMFGAADRCMNIGLCRKSHDRHDVPVVHGDARWRSTPPAAAPTRWSRRCREGDPHAALGDERLHEVLDLCLSARRARASARSASTWPR